MFVVWSAAGRLGSVLVLVWGVVFGVWCTQMAGCLGSYACLGCGVWGVVYTELRALSSLRGKGQSRWLFVARLLGGSVGSLTPAAQLLLRCMHSWVGKFHRRGEQVASAGVLLGRAVCGTGVWPSTLAHAAVSLSCFASACGRFQGCLFLGTYVCCRVLGAV